MATNPWAAAATSADPPVAITAEQRKQVLSQETNRLQEETLASLARTKNTLNQAEETGAATLTNLARQDEQIDNMQSKLDGMRNDVQEADVYLRKIASPFAFMFMKKEAKVFETLYKAPADWSGPLAKKGMLVHKKKYFVLQQNNLYMFDGETSINVDSLSKERGKFDLNQATLDKDRKKGVLTLKSADRKNNWVLRCADLNDFVGWVTMLEKHIAGDYKKTQEKASSPLGADSTEIKAIKQQHDPKQQQQQQSMPQENKSAFDQAVDEHMDGIMAQLDRLGHIGLEQAQTIQVQNQKLDVLEKSTAQAEADINGLQGKHARRLRE